MKREFHLRRARKFVAFTVAAAAVSCNAPDSGKVTNPIISGPSGISGAGSVTTGHNDNARTGQYPDEVKLTRANVNPSTFGLIGRLPVDGQVYAQPLFVKGVPVNGASQNLVFVATENDSVYAFDASQVKQDGSSLQPIWRKSLVPSGQTVEFWQDVNAAPNIYPNIGITATPVIDTTVKTTMGSGIIYVVAHSKEATAYNQPGPIHIFLHALDLASGAELPGSPVEIGGPPGSATDIFVEGTSKEDATKTKYDPDPNKTYVHFKPGPQLSRPALGLSNGKVYVSFGSQDDAFDTGSHGWIVSYQYTSKGLTRVNVFNSSPNSQLSSFWMAGNGPAFDSAGNLFATTGNGVGSQKDANGDTIVDNSESFVALHPDLSLSAAFQAADRVTADKEDLDLGSGGVVVLPDQQGPTPHLLVGSGKDCNLYAVNRDWMLSITPDARNPIQILHDAIYCPNGPAAYKTGLFSTPAYFQGKIFIVPINDTIKSIGLTNGQLDITTLSAPNDRSQVPQTTYQATYTAYNAQTGQGTAVNQQNTSPRGATVSISSNGASDGIAWFIDASQYEYYYPRGAPSFQVDVQYFKVIHNGPPVLFAYSTDNLAFPLYRSDQASSADMPSVDQEPAAGAVKFAVPTIADGKVFVGASGEVLVYGLKSAPVDASVPASMVVQNAMQTTATVTPEAASPSSGAQASETALAPGSVATIYPEHPHAIQTADDVLVRVSQIKNNHPTGTQFAAVTSASSTKVNFVMPREMTAGEVWCELFIKRKLVAATRLPLQSSAPTILATHEGYAAAQATTDQGIHYSESFRMNANTGKAKLAAIPVGASANPTYLVLYVSGLGKDTAPKLNVNGMLIAPAVYHGKTMAGPSPDPKQPGVEGIVYSLPASLQQAGKVSVQLEGSRQSAQLLLR